MPPESLNKVFLLGRVVGKPELRYTISKNPVATFLLRAKRPSSDPNLFDVFRVIAWGETALTCGNILRSGSRVFVKGHLEVRIIPGNSTRREERVEVIAELVDLREERQ